MANSTTLHDFLAQATLDFYYFLEEDASVNEEEFPTRTGGRQTPDPDLIEQIRAILDRVWTRVELSASPRAHREALADPEDFGVCVAYAVGGYNAGFTEVQRFHKAGVDGDLNRAVKDAGYTGIAYVAENIDGWVLHAN